MGFVPETRRKADVRPRAEEGWLCHDGKFFDMANDPSESKPIKAAARKKLQEIVRTLKHEQ